MSFLLPDNVAVTAALLSAAWMPLVSNASRCHVFSNAVLHFFKGSLQDPLELPSLMRIRHGRHSEESDSLDELKAV